MKEINLNTYESPEGRKIVGLLEHKGKVIVATERGVYMKNDENVFVRLRFEDEPREQKK